MMNIDAMSHSQYGLLFDVRRSVRYHDRRRAFFERMHQVTAGLTILLAGSVLLDLAKPGESAGWLVALSAVAALLSVWDMVVGYAAKAGLHRDLKLRFGALEMALLAGDAEDATWNKHQLERLRIEQDEPPVFRALDLLCHNELMVAEGFGRPHDKPAQFAKVGRWQRTTRHVFHWADLA